LIMDYAAAVDAAHDAADGDSADRAAPMEKSLTWTAARRASHLPTSPTHAGIRHRKQRLPAFAI
jgi:hypothetical protein